MASGGTRAGLKVRLLLLTCCCLRHSSSRSNLSCGHRSLPCERGKTVPAHQRDRWDRESRKHEQESAVTSGSLLGGEGGRGASSAIHPSPVVVEGCASLLTCVYDMTTRVCSVYSLDRHGSLHEVVKTLYFRKQHMPCLAPSYLS